MKIISIIFLSIIVAIQMALFLILLPAIIFLCVIIETYEAKWKKYQLK